ncbi:uncharacterized protein TNCV_147941 [Trichonephila clavipes]|nr:uncharacterized protein TNCV_147941 [Trichonephila clavipes]
MLKDVTEVSLGILLPEKSREHIEDYQRNITSCRNELGTFGTKDEEVTAEMDKGSMVADSFCSERECCAELALAWNHAKEDKGNYYEVDGYLFHRDKILGESTGQLVIPKCRRTEVLRWLEQFVVSLMVDIDILMQIWKNRVKQIDFVLEWLGRKSYRPKAN